MKKMNKKTIAAAALVLGLGANLGAQAINVGSESLFEISEATSLFTGPSASEDHKCGEGKCGEGKCGDDHKCGEGKCGDDHKCGEAKK